MFVIGTPYTKGAGYLLNNKDDPRTRQEADMQICNHCQASINMQEWKKRGAWCNGCMKPLCLGCGKLTLTEGCKTFKQKFDEYLEMQQKASKESPVPSSLIITGT